MLSMLGLSVPSSRFRKSSLLELIPPKDWLSWEVEGLEGDTWSQPPVTEDTDKFREVARDSGRFRERLDRLDSWGSWSAGSQKLLVSELARLWMFPMPEAMPDADSELSWFMMSWEAGG